MFTSRPNLLVFKRKVKLPFHGLLPNDEDENKIYNTLINSSKVITWLVGSSSKKRNQLKTIRELYYRIILQKYITEFNKNYENTG